MSLTYESYKTDLTHFDSTIRIEFVKPERPTQMVTRVGGTKSTLEYDMQIQVTNLSKDPNSYWGATQCYMMQSLYWTIDYGEIVAHVAGNILRGWTAFKDVDTVIRGKRVINPAVVIEEAFDHAA